MDLDFSCSYKIHALSFIAVLHERTFTYWTYDASLVFTACLSVEAVRFYQFHPQSN